MEHPINTLTNTITRIYYASAATHREPSATWTFAFALPSLARPWTLHLASYITATPWAHKQQPLSPYTSP